MGSLGRYLGRMIEMRVNIDGVIFTQHGYQFSGYPHGQRAGSSGADSDNLDARDLPEGLEDLFQAVI